MRVAVRLAYQQLTHRGSKLIGALLGVTVAVVLMFTQLGFKFNPQFTDENAACLAWEENIYFMVLKREFFATFTDAPACLACLRRVCIWLTVRPA